MCGSAACAISIGARTLMAKKRSQISGVSSAMPGQVHLGIGTQRRHADARIVDHRIDPAETLRRRGDNVLARLDVGEVGDERIDVARRGAEPREAGGVAIDRRDVVACGDQRAGDRRPDAAGRAGDEHNTRIVCHY